MPDAVRVRVADAAGEHGDEDMAATYLLSVRDRH
jgi:hypothetical protein